MKILSFSLDRSALVPQSKTNERLQLLAQLVEEFDVIVPTAKKKITPLNNNSRVIGSGGIAKAGQLWSLWQTARVLVKDRNYQIISVQDTNYVGLVAAFLAVRYRLALEVQVHGFEKQTWWRKHLTRLVLERATGVRVVSKRLRDFLVTQYEIAPEKIYIIPIYSQLGEVDGEAIVKTEPPLILAVGRLVPVKGFDYLIEAAHLLKQEGLIFQLKIVGSGGEIHHLRELVKKMSVADVVELVGQVNDPKPLYEAASVLAIPSLAEGYSLVAVEGALFGLPIVMTDVGLAGEILINNQSALIVPPGNIKELAKALKEALTDNGLAKRLGLAAQAAARALPQETETLHLYKQAWAKLL
jgi:glycosyltransferase involved in cell wall biosynthesis